MYEFLLSGHQYIEKMVSVLSSGFLRTTFGKKSAITLIRNLFSLLFGKGSNRGDGNALCLAELWSESSDCSSRGQWYMNDICYCWICLYFHFSSVCSLMNLIGIFL